MPGILGRISSHRHTKDLRRTCGPKVAAILSLMPHRRQRAATIITIVETSPLVVGDRGQRLSREAAGERLILRRFLPEAERYHR